MPNNNDDDDDDDTYKEVKLPNGIKIHRKV